MLACNCLNIIIELEKNDKVTKELLELTDEEKCDSFFKQEVWHVGKLVSIKKLYSDLVHSRHIGLWTISHCLNCDVQTHAIHRDKGASYVLVHSKLQNEEAINNVKSSSIFSPIFQIIINPNDIALDTTPLDTYLNKGVDKFIKNINDVVTNYLRNEQLSVEEKIKKFSNEQYDLFNESRDKAFKEKEALVRVIQNAARETNLYCSPKSPKTFMNFADKNSVPNSPLSVPFSPKRPKSTDAGKQLYNEDMKEDLMFDFEIEEFSTDGESSRNRNADDSESEEIEEAEDVVNETSGISIFQGKSTFPGGNLAKSCPVDIPSFSPLSRSKNSRGEPGEDTDDSSPHPNNEVDIAASIKALARSVHGDAIFGELPRPRFSTQI